MILNIVSLPYKVKTKKYSIKIDGWNHHSKNKMEGKKKIKKYTTHKNQKKLIPLVVGSYLMHKPF
jgi:hypothetical protein